MNSVRNGISPARAALLEARDRLMSMEPNVDDLRPEHRLAFRNGFSAARVLGQSVLNRMLASLPKE